LPLGDVRFTVRLRARHRGIQEEVDARLNNLVGRPP